MLCDWILKISIHLPLCSSRPVLRDIGSTIGCVVSPVLPAVRVEGDSRPSSVKGYVNKAAEVD